MQIRRGLLPAVALMIALSGFAAADERPAPPHPTMLFATYKGAQHPVIAVEKEDPVILVDGQRKRLRGNIPLSTERQPRYAGARAEITGQKAEIVQVVTANSEIDAEQARNTARATVGGYVEYAATITASQDLADCFVVLFAVDDDFVQGKTDHPNSQIRVRQLPNLRAHVATPIKFSTSQFMGWKKMTLFALVFAGGNEVATGRQPDIARYFHRRERLVHAATVKQWLAENPAASRPAQPLLQIPPIFAATEGFPTTTSANLTIGADGTVTELSFGGGFPASAERILGDALQAWLFLPQIKEGRPVAARVSVPLKF